MRVSAQTAVYMNCVCGWPLMAGTRFTVCCHICAQAQASFNSRQCLDVVAGQSEQSVSNNCMAMLTGSCRPPFCIEWLRDIITASCDCRQQQVLMGQQAHNMQAAVTMQLAMHKCHMVPLKPCTGPLKLRTTLQGMRRYFRGCVWGGELHPLHLLLHLHDLQRDLCVPVCCNDANMHWLEVRLPQDVPCHPVGTSGQQED